ncbi:MAG TPA: transglycosylase domain-containing protein, partial [Thermoleophilaceae bacterium]|nr:transglycosylase domain-containing protein [Thermoleophilaceae bacterium]
MHQQPPTATPPRPSPPAPEGGAAPPPVGKPKLKKLRLALILSGLGALALVSTVFGMMMAVASDLPQLENKAEYDRAENSTVYADPAAGRDRLARLTGNENRILLEEDQISPNIANAVIAIEDRRFYDHEGVDYRGIARALFQDILARRAAQGGSTITQQFVKNALAAQSDRSVFQKLREAALAYHLEREWSKQKVLTQYLNSVYFGNGAYGVEAAVRTYFGADDAAPAFDPVTGEPITEDVLDPAGSGDPAATTVSPAEAALLAGLIASPSMYDPVQNPKDSKARRDLVLQRMLEQEMITRSDYEEGIREELPDADDIQPPQPHSNEPYFTTWLTQQLVDRYGPGAVFGGGLDVTTTLDPDLQAAAEQAIAGRIGSIGPAASLVAIENRTGEVKAMVGGPDYQEQPFNLATNGHRQPGSSFKPFILIRALADGMSPDATFASQPKEFPVPGSDSEKFVVNNYEDSYSGVASLWSATANSDNSVYAEIGLDVGTKRVARLANRMGVRTEISTNPAMTLGGLREGVTPLELAYAYSTIANKGRRVSGTLASSEGGPVAIQSVKGAGRDVENERREERVFPDSVGETAHQLLAGVVSSGTGEAAQIGEFAAGKTGTTENYGDAWFVGFNNELTVAVWVGYPEGLKPMETEYLGGPVAGGTYPAEIWHDLMTAWIGIRDQRLAEREARQDAGEEDGEVDDTYVPSAPSTPTTPDGVVPEDEGPSDEAAPADPAPDAGGEAPVEPAPDPAPEPAPSPAPTPAPAPPPAPSPAPGGG